MNEQSISTPTASTGKIDVSKSVKEILGKVLPETVQPVPEVPKAPEPSFTPPEVAPTTPIAPSAPTQPETPKTPEVPKAEEVVTAKSPEENIKSLRKKYNETSRQVEEKDKTLNELRAELEKYQKGEIVPEVVNEYKDRISQLEYYERLHALQFSPKYKETYVQPLTEARDKLLSYAQDYNVDPAVFDRALQIENKRELNGFLREHFDDVGALEARDLLSNFKTLNDRAEEARKEPLKELEKLEQQAREEETRAIQGRMGRLVEVSQNSWVESLGELHQEGKYPELMIREGNENHNKISKPIIEKAAEEYGKFITVLAGLGARDLPPEVAKMLAKRFQLSQASAVIAESRAQHFNESQQMIDNARRIAPYARPPVGMNGGPTIEMPEKPKTPEERGRDLLRKTGVL